MLKRVAKVGVELEGAWEHEPPNGTFHHDGSVVITPDPTRTMAAVGEYVSPPLSPEQVAEFVREAWPTTVNATCGLHVHVSFKKRGQYLALADNAEQAEAAILAALNRRFTGRIVAHHRLFSRLRGENSFCRPFSHVVGDGQPNAVAALVAGQMSQRTKGGDRYHVLNFAWSLHQTVECRVLPMFRNSRFGVEAAQLIVETLDRFAAPRKTPKMTASGNGLTIRHRRGIAGDVLTVTFDANTRRCAHYRRKSWCPRHRACRVISTLLHGPAVQWYRERRGGVERIDAQKVRIPLSKRMVPYAIAVEEFTRVAERFSLTLTHENLQGR